MGEWLFQFQDTKRAFIPPGGGGRVTSNLDTQYEKYSRNMVKCCKGLASHPGDSKMHIEGETGSV